MPRSIGVVVSDHIVWGIVEGDTVRGVTSAYADGDDLLHPVPSDEMIRRIADEVKAVAEGEPLEAIGMAFPGIVQNGVIKESPNLHQLKGVEMEKLMREALAERGVHCEKVAISNDADVVAAGIAARHGKLDQLVRVWMLGNGIGFGRYPEVDGVWEGGHTVVTLDPNEKFCGCGGRGHLEGIMGHRAMRMRFLDMEPEEVFEEAKLGDIRCLEFKRLWHKALAAATATSIHLRGPGRFFLAGFNVRFVDMPLLRGYLQQMVKMSPLQSYTIEIVKDDQETRVIGAAVSAEKMGC